jgi:hypothetical protein
LNRANKDENFLKNIITRDEMGLWIRCWNKSSVNTMGVKRVTTTEKSKTSAVKF